MRNFRKTRKRGGLSVSIVLECLPPFKSMDRCEAEFLRQNNFMRVRIPGDGNCFYHALSRYYQLSNPPGSVAPTHLQLRDRVVQEMEDNIDEASVGLIVNMSNIPNNASPANREVLEMAKYLEALEDLREPGVWNSNNADVVSQFAARALNIRLKIFDKREAVPARRIRLSRFNNGREVFSTNPAQPARIICYTFEPDGYGGAETINLFRVGDGHYELLYPQAAPVAPKGRRGTAKKANGGPGKNLVSNTAAKLAAVKLSNKKNNTAKKDNKSGPTTRSKAKAAATAAVATVANNSKTRRKSLENALKLIANMEKKEAAAAKKAQEAAKKEAAKKPAEKRRTASLENALMKIALQESEEQEKKNKQRRAELNSAFFEALEFANFEK